MTAAAVRVEGVVHREKATPRWRPGGFTTTPSSGRGAVCPGAGPVSQSDSRLQAVTRLRMRRAWRRRVLLGAACTAVLVALALPWGGAGRRPLATAGSVLAGAAVSPHALYVVQPGDTMWTIAERLDPGADPRPVIARLEAEVGSDTLQPGERLRLP